MYLLVSRYISEWSTMDTLFQWNHAHIVFAKFTNSVPTPLLIDLLVLDRTRSENVIPKDPGTMWHHTSNVAEDGEINLINKAFWGEFWPMDYYRQPPPPKFLFTATKKHTHIVAARHGTFGVFWYESYTRKRRTTSLKMDLELLMLSY